MKMALRFRNIVSPNLRSRWVLKVRNCGRPSEYDMSYTRYTGKGVSFGANKGRRGWTHTSYKWSERVKRTMSFDANKGALKGDGRGTNEETHRRKDHERHAADDRDHRETLTIEISPKH